MPDRTFATLVQDCATETAQLREVLAAYEVLEKLLACSADSGSPAEPHEVGALLRLLNGGLHRQIALLESSVGTMGSALAPAPAPEPGQRALDSFSKSASSRASELEI